MDHIIKECNLSKEGGISLVGWSMGNIFLLALVAAIVDENMDEDIRANLQQYVRSILLWGT